MSLHFSRQFAILLEAGLNRSGQTTDLADLARATGIRYQTLSNLIRGVASGPRLDTLLRLCEHFNISLDYFACDTEAACLDYLYAGRASPLIIEIERHSQRLSADGQRSVLTIIDGIEAASAHR